MPRRYRFLFVVGIISLSVAGLLPTVSTAGAGGFCSDAPFSDAATTEIRLSKMCFSPTVARIGAGDTVTFTNDDGTLHMVGGVNNVFGDLHTELPAGESLSYRFKEEGVYPYMCILHPGMGGAIVVGDGKGKAGSAAAFTVPPPAEEEAEPAPAAESAPVETEPTSDSGSPRWIVPVAVALGVAVLGLAAIPMKRRSGSGAITTKI